MDQTDTILIVLIVGAAVALAVTEFVQRKFGIERKRLKQKSVHQRLDKFAERFRFGEELDDGSLFGAMSNEEEDSQRKAIMRSGMKISALSFWASRMALAAAGAVAGVYLVNDSADGFQVIAAGVLGLIVGWMIPQLLLFEKRAKWRANIERELPNTLDLMAVSMSAGTTFEDAVRSVAENSEGDLAEGLRDVVANSRFMDITDALKIFADNANVQPLTIFVASLIQARRTGAQFVEVLENQARTVRTYRRQKLEEEINKLPVKMLFPIGLLIFPALFGFILLPAMSQISGSLSLM